MKPKSCSLPYSQKKIASRPQINVVPYHAYGGVKVQIYSFLTSVLDGGESSVWSPGHLDQEKETPVPIQ